MDHVAIYLLIAGTYTPLTLVTLRGAWGWTLFGIVWGLAIIGIVVDALHRQGARRIQILIYLLMGWLIVVALYSLVQVMPMGGLTFLLLGGLFYTSGIVFYALDGWIKHSHGIWHLFVLAGSISHYLIMLFMCCEPGCPQQDGHAVCGFNFPQFTTNTVISAHF